MEKVSIPINAETEGGITFCLISMRRLHLRWRLKFCTSVSGDLCWTETLVLRHFVCFNICSAERQSRLSIVAVGYELGMVEQATSRIGRTSMYVQSPGGQAKV